MKYYSKIINCYVFMIICIVPLFFIPFSQSDPFLLPKVALWTASFFITLLLILLVRFRTTENYISIPSSKIYKLLAIYTLVWIVSTIFSFDKMTSLTGIPLYNGLLQLIMCIGTFLLVSNLFEFKVEYIKYLGIVYSFVAVYAILQFYNLDPFTTFYGPDFQKYIGQTFSTIGNQNQVSTCLSVIFMILSFFYIIEEKGSSYNILFFICSLLIFAGTLATKTRGGWLSIAITMIIALPILLKNRSYLKRFLTLALLCISITLFMDFTSGNLIMIRISSIFTEAGSLTSGDINPELGSNRMEVWINSIDLIKQYWLIGSGPDTFNLIYNDPSYHKTAGDSYIISPHNESLSLLITTGIFSLILYWWIVIQTIKDGIKILNENKVVIPLLLALITYLIKGMFNCSVITDMIIFWVLLAIIFSFTMRSPNPSPPQAKTNHRQ